MKKKVGLYFGTFNPIHIGHLVIANHMAEFSELDEIWMVVTPHNPFKNKKTLLDNRHRFELVYRATESYPHLKPTDVEFGLPQPNYTVNTLAVLGEKFPELDFALIMGEDNLNSFHKWKNHEVILERHQIYVYPRIHGGSISSPYKDHPRVRMVNAPVMELSSTFIRKAIADGKDIRPMLPQPVWEYIDEMNFYRS